MPTAPCEIGFVGLGQMGKHMARNLLCPQAGLTVCDLNDELFASFREAGAKATREVADLAGCDIVFLSLPGDAAVTGVVLGDQGLLNRMRKGSVLVDTSTISVTATQDLAKALAAKGIEFIDAPVSGMESRAKDGTLSVMAGGDVAVLERVLPYLERVGNKILHVGPVGSGQLTKLINQLLFDINMAALAEVLPMAAKMGLDPVKTGEIVNSGTGRSYASEFFIPRILDNNFGDGYPMRHAYKDLVSGSMLSAREGIPLPVTQAATATYQAALLKGYGDEDKGAMIKVFEELVGAEYRKRE